MEWISVDSAVAKVTTTSIVIVNSKTMFINRYLTVFAHALEPEDRPSFHGTWRWRASPEIQVLQVVNDHH